MTTTHTVLHVVNLVLFAIIILHLVRVLWTQSCEGYNNGTDANLWFQPGDSTFCSAVGAGPAKPYGSPKLPTDPAQVDPIDWQMPPRGSPMPAAVWAQTGGGTFCRPYGTYDSEAGVTA